MAKYWLGKVWYSSRSVIGLPQHVFVERKRAMRLGSTHSMLALKFRQLLGNLHASLASPHIQ